MARPSYTPDAFATTFEALDAIPWVDRVEARRECFMSPTPRLYTYGAGTGKREYASTPMLAWVADIMAKLDGSPNVCFLNRYEHERNALGWHSDDSPDTSNEHPISVVSFGAAREIWWRAIGEGGIVAMDQRQLLEPGSLFVMPPGFQLTHEHRIPKGDKPMSWRVSLTFRRMHEP